MNFMPAASSFAPSSADDCVVDPSGLGDHNGKRWTEQYIITLANLVRAEGLANGAAALRMGRAESPIATAVSRFGARDPNAQLSFASRAVASSSRCSRNRICSKCVRQNHLECA